MLNAILNIKGCMNWTAAGCDGRYGKFTLGSRLNGTKKTYNAHRVSYELFIGKIPKGEYVLHRCDNTLCVNPEHLFLGTQYDNMQDMIKKGRANHPSYPSHKKGKKYEHRR